MGCGRDELTREPFARNALEKHFHAFVNSPHRQPIGVNHDMTRGSRTRLVIRKRTRSARELKRVALVRANALEGNPKGRGLLECTIRITKRGRAPTLLTEDRSPAAFPGHSENSSPEEAARIPLMDEWGKAGTSSGADGSRRKHHFPSSRRGPGRRCSAGDCCCGKSERSRRRVLDALPSSRRSA